jgi:hypothetical protein
MLQQSGAHPQYEKSTSAYEKRAAATAAVALDQSPIYRSGQLIEQAN